MAFIRWKKDRAGIRRAHLVHSYRDEAGRMRQKSLAYLGRKGVVSSERLTQLREKHKDWNIPWEAIRPVDHPPPRIDIAGLSDTDLLRQLREIRHERRLSLEQLVQALHAEGLPPCSATRRPDPLTVSWYVRLERAFSKEGKEHLFKWEAPWLCPYLRKVLC